MPIGPFSDRGPLRVQPFFGFRNSDRLFLSARALHSHEPTFENRGFFGDLKTMLSQYASHEVEGLEIEFGFETASGHSIRETAISGPEGFVQFEVDLPANTDLPFKTGWEKAALRWGARADEHEAGDVPAHILAPGRDAGIGIISDIDDTILETGITGDIRAIARNWKRVMAQMPEEREIVPGARGFYSALGGRHGTEAGDDGIPQSRPRPVFYVSSSPWNLYSYLVEFQRLRDMPLGPIMLRDWGFNRKTLGSESHGSHKRAAIERIIRQYPHLRFALVGDDTQKDLVAFGEIAASMPDRIAAVFIRRISSEAPNQAEQSARDAIKAAGVPFWMGADYNEARAMLTDAGLEFDSKVETLVKTASEGKDAASRAAPAAGTTGE
ncbi:MAG: phosphatase domain-containing protein [Pseudomonadota bacterium]